MAELDGLSLISIHFYVPALISRLHWSDAAFWERNVLCDLSQRDTCLQ